MRDGYTLCRLKTASATNKHRKKRKVNEKWTGMRHMPWRLIRVDWLPGPMVAAADKESWRFLSNKFNVYIGPLIHRRLDQSGLDPATPTSIDPYIHRPLDPSTTTSIYLWIQRPLCLSTLGSIDHYIHRALDPATPTSIDPWIHRFLNQIDPYIQRSIGYIHRLLEPSTIGSINLDLINPWIHRSLDPSTLKSIDMEPDVSPRQRWRHLRVEMSKPEKTHGHLMGSLAREIQNLRVLELERLVCERV